VICDLSSALLTNDLCQRNFQLFAAAAIVKMLLLLLPPAIVGRSSYLNHISIHQFNHLIDFFWNRSISFNDSTNTSSRFTLFLGICYSADFEEESWGFCTSPERISRMVFMS
jgi:hypothetical protein